MGAGGGHMTGCKERGWAREVGHMTGCEGPGWGQEVGHGTAVGGMLVVGRDLSKFRQFVWLLWRVGDRSEGWVHRHLMVTTRACSSTPGR